MRTKKEIKNRIEEIKIQILESLKEPNLTLIRIGFLDATNFKQLQSTNNTFYTRMNKYEEKENISLTITYKQDEFNNDLILFFNTKEKRLNFL